MGCYSVAFLALVVAAPALSESVKPLIGRWVCTARTYNGEASDLDPCTWEFAAGAKLIRRMTDRWPAEWRFTADPAKSPPQIDWKDGEDTVAAIYKVDGDTLTLCYCHTANDRPTRFDSPKGAHLVLLSFKRAKPAGR
jgi:uncharacterized protein (TIGR03067 family)